jgi:hypothetical protein
MKKKVLLGVAAVVVAIQFIRPEENRSNENTYHISTRYALSEGIKATLQAACNDCHTNSTRYPWYSNVQPVAWWLNKHVTEGKRHLNLSEFTHRPLAYQNHKFEEIVEMVEEGEMPLPSYTYLGLHAEARLSGSQRSELIAWAKAQMDTLKAHYPADSLVLRRRTPPPGRP